jgi:hypothetical protein
MATPGWPLATNGGLLSVRFQLHDVTQMAFDIVLANVGDLTWGGVDGGVIFVTALFLHAVLCQPECGGGGFHHAARQVILASSTGRPVALETSFFDIPRFS